MLQRLSAPPLRLADPPPRLSQRAREAAIAAAAAILAQGRPTPFAFEAACRHSLRANLCLAGHRWPAADLTAAGIVAAALARLGAERPSWQEGQPAWTDSAATSFLRVVCETCGRALPEQEAGFGHGQPRRYCSRSCAVNAWNRRNADWKRAYDLARWHALKAAWPKAACAQCGAIFPQRPVTAGRPPTKYCSHGCSVRARTKRPRA